MSRSYFVAALHSWWWHLTYGMWRGYCEMRTYEMGLLLKLASVDSANNEVKVFWSTP